MLFSSMYPRLNELTNVKFYFITIFVLFGKELLTLPVIFKRILLYIPVHKVDKVFTYGPGDWDSSLGRVISKTQKKWYLMRLCLTLSIIRYVSEIKWSNPENGVAPSPSSRCSRYWKESLWITLDHSCQLYLYMCVHIL